MGWGKTLQYCSTAALQGVCGGKQKKRKDPYQCNFSNWKINVFRKIAETVKPVEYIDDLQNLECPKPAYIRGSVISNLYGVSVLCWMMEKKFHPNQSWKRNDWGESIVLKSIWIRINRHQEDMTSNKLLYVLLHLCFNITMKGQTIVPDWCNRNLQYTRKYVKNNVFQWK